VNSLIKIDLAGYYSYLDDALVRRDFKFNGQDSILYDGEMSGVQAIQNAAFAYVWGVHAGFELSIYSGLRLTSKFNYQKGERKMMRGTKYP
jgi:hemoglobin/transferrin/lactoferrin receptor protein